MAIADRLDNAAFWFIIPLRAKAASKDWARVCALLRATVRSTLNQSDPHFHILIACHDIPDLGDIDDSRVTILSGVFPAPTTLLEQAYDKRAKKRLAAVEVRKQGGGYIMLLDSDDFVSRRIVAHVRQDRNPAGYYFPDGYEYFAQDGVIRPLAQFYRLCGSCYIVNYRIDQLPESMDSPETDFDAFKNHRLARETADGLGMTLAPLPFPGAVYLRENGENHSVQTAAARRLSRHKIALLCDRIRRKLFKSHAIPDALVREFTLPR